MADDALIFVYGTLRPGGSAEARMIGHGRWLGPATATGRLYRISHYPGFVADTGDDVVQGAVFEAADPGALLAELDIYEGCGPDDDAPHEYQRVRIDICHRGRSRTAWAYVYAWPVDEANHIGDGDFLRAPA
ncbi:gamma-glutamylcyclotransferase family protein [Sphingomonas colocasiae]|uniref:Gamma-glutamylcyclotransferase n=1 Tax=Sphingomonas colocasiae TaxID=1848973 RepID=A0ABS7PU74_9SPHN|nr:gamma-glutamylcyclotransferase family protein [Sphingomonas colocasiae]MBY8824748.1 gamma-glutamylcyclotransferase [Sphingomonas colocasiae]